MKILNAKFTHMFLTLFLLVNGLFLICIHTASAKGKCTFISPFAMQESLKKKYPNLTKYSKEVDYLEYTWEISKDEDKRLEKCEVSLLDEVTNNEEKLKYLNERYDRALTGPNIEGGDYIKGDFYLLSVCQHHACISNIHSDVFDKQGHLIVSMMYIYPSPDTSSPQGQQLADILDGKHKEHYYPLEAWVSIRKEFDTPELRTFIKEAFENLQKGSGATIVAVHGMSKE